MRDLFRLTLGIPDLTASLCALARAIGRAWRRRKMLEAGEVATLADLAAEEGSSDRNVSRLLRLAWLAPNVLERLVVRREPCAITIYELCLTASLPWEEQMVSMFERIPAIRVIISFRPFRPVGY